MLVRWLTLLIITHPPHFIRFIRITREPSWELSSQTGRMVASILPVRCLALWAVRIMKLICTLFTPVTRTGRGGASSNTFRCRVSWDSRAGDTPRPGQARVRHWGRSGGNMHKNGPDWFPATGHDCDGKMGQIGTEIQRMMILAESGPSHNNTQVSDARVQRSQIFRA